MQTITFFVLLLILLAAPQAFAQSDDRLGDEEDGEISQSDDSYNEAPERAAERIIVRRRLERPHNGPYAAPGQSAALGAGLTPTNQGAAGTPLPPGAGDILPKRPPRHTKCNSD